MDLSIIILNYKQKGLVKQCIKGILDSRIELNYEIIVVDNNSKDSCLESVENSFKPTPLRPMQTPSLLNKLEPKLPPLITIQSKENNGFASGNNLGIKKAKGKYVLILNPDIAIVSGGLEKMVSFMEKNTEIGILGPKLINPDGSIQDSCRRFPSWPIPLYRRTMLGKLPIAKKALSYYLMGDWNHATNAPVDWLFGASLLMRKSVLDSIGLFDERFFMYLEDLDLCRRCWEKGFKVFYFADIEMIHYHQRLSAEKAGVLSIFSKAGRVHLISGIKYFGKYLGVRLPSRN